MMMADCQPSSAVNRTARSFKQFQERDRDVSPSPSRGSRDRVDLLSHELFRMQLANTLRTPLYLSPGSPPTLRTSPGGGDRPFTPPPIRSARTQMPIRCAATPPPVRSTRMAAASAAAGSAWQSSAPATITGGEPVCSGPCSAYVASPLPSSPPAQATVAASPPDCSGPVCSSVGSPLLFRRVAPTVSQAVPENVALSRADSPVALSSPVQTTPMSPAVGHMSSPNLPPTTRLQSRPIPVPSAGFFSLSGSSSSPSPPDSASPSTPPPPVRGVDTPPPPSLPPTCPHSCTACEALRTQQSGHLSDPHSHSNHLASPEQEGSCRDHAPYWPGITPDGGLRFPGGVLGSGTVQQTGSSHSDQCCGGARPRVSDYPSFPPAARETWRSEFCSTKRSRNQACWDHPPLLRQGSETDSNVSSDNGQRQGPQGQQRNVPWQRSLPPTDDFLLTRFLKEAVHLAFHHPASIPAPSLFQTHASLPFGRPGGIFMPAPPPPPTPFAPSFTYPSFLLQMFPPSQNSGPVMFAPMGRYLLDLLMTDYNVGGSADYEQLQSRDHRMAKYNELRDRLEAACSGAESWDAFTEMVVFQARCAQWYRLEFAGLGPSPGIPPHSCGLNSSTVNPPQFVPLQPGLGEDIADDFNLFRIAYLIAFMPPLYL